MAPLTASDRQLHADVLYMDTEYAGETLQEYTHVETIDLTAATPAALSFPVAIQDGTNRVAITEVVISCNDFVAATGTADGHYIELTRDGLGTPEVVESTIIDASEVIVPRVPKWRTTDFYIEASITGTYQVILRTIYYTPR